MFELNPLTSDHAGRFTSGLGWSCSFQPTLGVYTHQNNENAHIRFQLFGLRRPSLAADTCIPLISGIAAMAGSKGMSAKAS